MSASHPGNLLLLKPGISGSESCLWLFQNVSHAGLKQQQALLTCHVACTTWLCDLHLPLTLPSHTLVPVPCRCPVSSPPQLHKYSLLSPPPCHSGNSYSSAKTNLKCHLIYGIFSTSPQGIAMPHSVSTAFAEHFWLHIRTNWSHVICPSQESSRVRTMSSFSSKSLLKVTSVPCAYSTLLLQGKFHEGRDYALFFTLSTSSAKTSPWYMVGSQHILIKGMGRWTVDVLTYDCQTSGWVFSP